MHTILIKVMEKISFSHIWVREKHYVLSKSQGKIFFRTAENPSIFIYTFKVVNFYAEMAKKKK